METREGERSKEQEARELAEFVKTIPWENGYIFEFAGIAYFLCVTTEEELAECKTAKERKEKYGESAEYFGSDTVDGFDIYLHDTIPGSERERVLFHEISETIQIRGGKKRDDAHAMACKAEEQIYGKRKMQEPT